MPDPIDRFFDDLSEPGKPPPEKDYPGKREPLLRQQQSAKTGPKDIEAWDMRPRTYKFRGVDVEFFTIQHVARALNRSARSIRDWEKAEIIPPATYRSPTPRRGSDVKAVGDRLWTRAQVEAMVRAAQEEGILDGKAPTKTFTRKVIAAFLALQEHPNRNPKPLQEHT